MAFTLLSTSRLTTSLVIYRPCSFFKDQIDLPRAVNRYRITIPFYFLPIQRTTGESHANYGNFGSIYRASTFWNKPVK